MNGWHIYAFFSLLGVVLLFSIGVSFRVTETNPGGNSYTLNEKLENRVPIQKIPTFIIVETLDATDAVFNLLYLIEFTFILWTLLPIGVLIVVYFVLIQGPFPEGMMAYKWIVFVYIIYSIVAPIYFWFYLLLQSTTIFYKAIWILFPGALAWIFYRYFNADQTKTGAEGI